LSGTHNVYATAFCDNTVLKREDSNG